MKKKEKPLDASDLLIETRLCGQVDTFEGSMSDSAIYHLSRKVIASQMAKITWPRSRLYERNSENGRE